jgi:23S rRNA pseudouridine2605 synthase
LGEALAEEAGADFDAPIFHMPKQEPEKKRPASKSGGRDGGAGREKSQGKWLTAREGKSVTDRKKAAKADGEGSRQGKRKNEGPRREKVSPRSRFRLTSEPRPRRDYGDDRPEPPKRRIWGEEGLVDDKQQERRSNRDKNDRGGPPRDGRPPRRGDRS